MLNEILIKIFAIIFFIAKYSGEINALPQNYINTIVLEPYCIDNETGKKLLVGDTLNRINKCTRIQCIGDEIIWQYECNVPSLNGNCVEIEDPNSHRTYPDCCPRYLCTKEHSSGNYVEKTIYDQYGNQIKKAITRIIQVTSYDRNNITILTNDVI